MTDTTNRLRRRARAWATVLTAVVAAGCEELPNVPPSAAFIFSPVAPVFAGQTRVTFNASGSRDSDGRIVSYLWNFGDGSAEQRSDGPVVTHVFADTPARCLDITYAVLLTVTDDRGGQATASATVPVTEDCR